MNDIFPENIACVNFNVLKNLRGMQKLRIINLNQLELDNRYLPLSRRTLSGDSRTDLLKIIEKSFDTLRHSDPMFTESEQQTLIHLQQVLKKTYPTFYELHGPDGLIHTLLTRSREFEAQRKAHEIIREYSAIKTDNNITGNTNYPDIFEPIIREYSAIKTDNNITGNTNYPDIFELYPENKQSTQSNMDDDKSEKGCCFCVKK